MATMDLRLQKAQQAIDSIGLGFDITKDICFENCKKGPRLILVNEEDCRELKIPGGVSIPNVPYSITCYGEGSLRINSEVRSFEEMSRLFNRQMCLADNTPSGHFCASFGLPDRNKKDLVTIRSLAYDGWFIRRYAFELARYDDGEPHEYVKEAMPLSWDPEALVR